MMTQTKLRIDIPYFPSKLYDAVYDYSEAETSHELRKAYSACCRGIWTDLLLESAWMAVREHTHGLSRLSTRQNKLRSSGEFLNWVHNWLEERK